MKRAVRGGITGCVVVLMGLIPASISVAQPPKPPGACSLLTKAEVKRIAAVKDQFFDQIPAREEPIGATGSACAYSGIHIQLNAFTADRLEELRKGKGPAWTPVANVGDAAYVFDNKNAGAHYAELYARAGQHVVTVQISVRPPEASLETVRPQLIALAQALVAKLR